MTAHTHAMRLAGVGLRLQHLAEVAATRPAAAWFEIHPENYLANPHAAELLFDIAGHYPISVHTVGVSVGSAGGVDRAHLKRVKALIDRLDPIMVSGHLAWSTHEGDYLNDLLPLPYDRESLGIVAAHINEVQDALGRPYHLENPSLYLGFKNSTMTEVEFLGELVARTDCRLLCDVSNVHVSARNLGYDAYRYIDEFPADAVGELHLGGFVIEDEDGPVPSQVLIDTHSRPIDDHAWDLYAHAIRRFGPKPTLIEWDNELPDFATLAAEAARADRTAAAGARREHPMPLLAETQGEFRHAVAAPDRAVFLDLVAPTAIDNRLAIYRRHYREGLSRHIRGRFPTVEWLLGSTRMVDARRALRRRLAAEGTLPCRIRARFRGLHRQGHRGDGLALCRRPRFARLASRRRVGSGRPAGARYRAPRGMRPRPVARPCADTAVRAPLSRRGLADRRSGPHPDERCGPRQARLHAARRSHSRCAVPAAQFGIRRLEPVTGRFRREIAAGQSLGAAAERALAEDPAFDISTALASLFAEGLVTSLDQSTEG